MSYLLRGIDQRHCRKPARSSNNQVFYGRQGRARVPRLRRRRWLGVLGTRPEWLSKRRRRALSSRPLIRLRITASSNADVLDPTAIASLFGIIFILTRE